MSHCKGYWVTSFVTLTPRSRSNTVFSCKCIHVVRVEGTGQHFVKGKKHILAMVYHQLKSSLKFIKSVFVCVFGGEGEPLCVRKCQTRC